MEIGIFKQILVARGHPGSRHQWGHRPQRLFARVANGAKGTIGNLVIVSGEILAPSACPDNGHLNHDPSFSCVSRDGTRKAISTLECQKRLDYAICRPAVAEMSPCMRLEVRAPLGVTLSPELRRGQNTLRFRAGQHIGAALEGFDPLCLIAQSDARAPEKQGLLLQPAGIRKHHARVLHERQHVEVSHRIHQSQAIVGSPIRQAIGQDGRGTRMHGKHERHSIFRGELVEGIEQAPQPRAVVGIFRPMNRHDAIGSGLQRKPGMNTRALTSPTRDNEVPYRTCCRPTAPHATRVPPGPGSPSPSWSARTARRKCGPSPRD